jgi:hypothetical protein
MPSSDEIPSVKQLFLSLVLGDVSTKSDMLHQEPLSAALSAVNLLMHFTGWLSFFLLVNYKLPLRPQAKRTYYEYTSLWHIYAILSMNAWFWSTIFHTRYEIAQSLQYILQFGDISVICDI